MDSSHGGWSSHRFHTELQLEKFLAAAATVIREMEGGPTSGDPNDIPGSFHTWCWTQPQTAGECPPSQRGPFNKFALVSSLRDSFGNTFRAVKVRPVGDGSLSTRTISA